MDDDDIHKLLFEGQVHGAHTVAGWEVHRRGAVDPRYDRMVSVHEALHDQLHGSTGYGGLLHVLAYLSRNGEERVSSQLGPLIARCRITHEAYATYLSLLVVGEGTLDLALLGDNPRYRAYAEVASQLAGGLRGGFLRYQAVAASLRACLQTELVDAIAKEGLVAWASGRSPPGQHPDELLARVLRTPFDWLEVVRRCRAAKPELLGWDSFLRSEDEPELYAELVQDAYDATADALLIAMHDEVRRKVPGIVGFNDHRATLPTLIAQAHALVPPSQARRPIHMAPTEESSETEILASFAEERMFLREEPLTLVVHPPPTRAAELVCGSGGLEHLYVVAQPAHRLRGQHALVGELPSGHLVTGLQKTEVGAEGARVVHFFPLPSAASLTALLEQLPEGHSVLACVSLLAYADAAWCDEWLAPLRGASLLTVLVDNDPFRHLEIWSRQAGLTMRYGAMHLPAEAPLHSLLALRPEGAPELFLIPCSISLSSALSRVLANHLPDGHGLVHDTGFLERADRGAVGVLLGHLIGEGWFLDFRSAEGYASAKGDRR